MSCAAETVAGSGCACRIAKRSAKSASSCGGFSLNGSRVACNCWGSLLKSSCRRIGTSCSTAELGSNCSSWRSNEDGKRRSASSSPVKACRIRWSLSSVRRSKHKRLKSEKGAARKSAVKIKSRRCDNDSSGMALMANSNMAASSWMWRC
ncbi:hypothetical protein M514_12380 [Trichuris suis]|uniref:Uncharacterized protein n=1 Tax=Trichuris suis TaxID=68888 RepID=A0A085MTW5_9BILA|nr:hypothetical protein M513_12380 [Trichuris suis]KFD60661.1 hypothetical protein M514_12380 [Trichuris suis]